MQVYANIPTCTYIFIVAAFYLAFKIYVKVGYMRLFVTEVLSVFVKCLVCLKCLFGT